MSVVGRVLLVLIVYLLPLYSDVNATLDESSVFVGQKVELKIVALGQKVEFPNIEKIGGSEVRAHESKRLEWFSDKGEFVKWVKIYEFYPKKSTKITSLPIFIDGRTEYTKPLRLTVKEANGKDDSFFVNIKTSKKRVYLYEPLEVMVIFSHKLDSDVLSVDFIPIFYENFWVKEEGGKKEYIESGFKVYEKKYILFPQKATKLNIGPVEVKAAVTKRIEDAFGNIVKRPKWITLSSKPRELFVEALPEGINLVGDYSLNVEISNKEIEAGKPISLNVMVDIVEGNIDDFELSEPKINGVMVYAQEPRVDYKLKAGKLVGRWEREFVLIAESSFTIPPFSFSYFSLDKKSVQEVSSKPIFVKVKEEVVRKKEYLDEAKVLDEKKNGYLSYILYPIFFVLGMATMYLFLRRKKERKRVLNQTNSEEKMLQMLLPYISESKDAAQMAEDLYAFLFEKKAVKIDKRAFKKLLESLKSHS